MNDGLIKNNVTIDCIDQEGNVWLKYISWSYINTETNIKAVTKFDKIKFSNHTKSNSHILPNRCKI